MCQPATAVVRSTKCRLPRADPPRQPPTRRRRGAAAAAFAPPADALSGTLARWRGGLIAAEMARSLYLEVSCIAVLGLGGPYAYHQRPGRGLGDAARAGNS